MKPIHDVRESLREIPGALVETSPDPAHRGLEEGVAVTTLSEGWSDAEGMMDAPTNNVDLGYPDESDGGFGSIPEFDPVFEIGPESEESFPSLGGEEGERIRKSVEIHGIDALGWYSSFHVTGAQWGIYIPISGIATLVKGALWDLPSTVEAKMNLAFHAILNHELFHFATDCVVAQSELLFEEPWWVPAKEAFHAGSPSYCVQEEKLANAYMLRAFRTLKPALRVRGKQEALKQYVLKQPEGYRDGGLVAKEGWGCNLTDLAVRYAAHSKRGSKHSHVGDGRRGRWDWPHQFQILPRIDWRHCPIHLIHDGASLGIPDEWLNFFGRLESINESDSFLRRFKKLGPPIQDAWRKKKARLQECITRGLDFKQWPKAGQGVWSVKVNQNFRAHLRHETNGTWTAFEVGGHKEMGHG
jgi:hypothetical protein